MRCPACGALAGPGADWCTQCYADLRPGPAPDAGSPGPGADEPAPRPDTDAAPGDPATRPASAASPAEASEAEAGSRDVRVVDGEVEWRCATCDGWNPLTVARCTACDAPRSGFGDAPGPRAVDAADRPTLVLASVVLPGLGHLLVGRTGTGVARALTALTWLVGAVLLATAGGRGRLAAAPLLLGAVVVWAGTLRDVLALTGGGRELLTARVLLWLTGGVVLALLLALATGTVS